MSETTCKTYNEKSKKYIQTLRTNHKETYLNYVVNIIKHFMRGIVKKLKRRS